MKPVLVDAGPLVAISSRLDSRHQVCIDALGELPERLLCCWPVITEAAWLLRDFPPGWEKILASLDRGSIEVLSLAGTEAKAIGELMNKYKDIRPQFADAALVYLAHRERIDTIFTLNRRDFSIYRNGRGRPFHLVPDIE
ncbi:MAG TPA: PIN domain-containing protein [Candidatus Sulfotelmatobacter sp.]